MHQFHDYKPSPLLSNFTSLYQSSLSKMRNQTPKYKQRKHFKKKHIQLDVLKITKLQWCHLRCHFRSNLRGFACLCHDLDQLDKIPTGKIWKDQLSSHWTKWLCMSGFKIYPQKRNFCSPVFCDATWPNRSVPNNQPWSMSDHAQLSNGKNKNNSNNYKQLQRQEQQEQQPKTKGNHNTII